MSHQATSSPRLFTYIVTSDSGYSPNPFWRYCTLACCKPGIRRTAKLGDWIVGISPKKSGNRAVYAMRVTEPPMTFAEYFHDRRFANKKPNYRSGSIKRIRGDNCYEPLQSGEYRQLRCRHSLPGGAENPDRKRTDLSGKFVLISNDFVYFGAKAVSLPDRLRGIIPGRGHQCNFDEKTTAIFLKYFKNLPRGIKGNPEIWTQSKSVCE